MVDASNPLPRQVAEGVHWLGRCGDVPYKGSTLHSYNSPYLVCGTHSSLLVDTGFPSYAPVVQAQLTQILTSGAPPLRYVFSTHQEAPHGGGLGWLLTLYPEALGCGSTSDFHLAYPEVADRLRPNKVGDRIDLGGTEIRVVEAIVPDLQTTLWAFDTARRVLFPADGFATLHYHDKRHCGLFAEEAHGLDMTEMTEFFAQGALSWTKLTNMRDVVRRLDRQLAELRVKLVCPTHGLPIRDVAATYPSIRAGLIAVGTDDAPGELS